MSNQNLPRGIRNKNPLNIELTGDKWRGLSSEQTDGRFAQFETAIWGIRAAAVLIQNYQTKRNLSTINQIISRWAPDHENDTNNYANFVSKQTGIPADETRDWTQYDNLRPLLEAMIQMENGLQPYTDAEFDKALTLAGVEVPARPSRTMKGAAIAGGATASAPILAQTAEAVSPYIPIASTLAKAAPWVLAVLTLIAISWIVYARWDDKRKGLR